MKKSDPLNSWKEKLEGLEEIPGVYVPDKAALWERMQSRLAQDELTEVKKKRNYTYWLAAATVIILFSLLLFLKSNDEEVQPVIVSHPKPLKKIDDVPHKKEKISDPGQIVKQQPVKKSNNTHTLATQKKRIEEVKIIPPDMPDTLINITKRPPIVPDQLVEMPLVHDNVLTNYQKGKTGSPANEFRRIIKRKTPEVSAGVTDEAAPHEHILIKNLN